MQFILDRQRYSRDQSHDFHFGIDRLLNDETYIAAYPLHDGEITTKGSRRHLLYTKWATLKVSDNLEVYLMTVLWWSPSLTEILAVSAIGLHQKLFRCQDRNLLRMAGFLYLHANSSVDRWCCEFHVLIEVDAQQSNQPTDMPKQRYDHHVSFM